MLHFSNKCIHIVCLVYMGRLVHEPVTLVGLWFFKCKCLLQFIAFQESKGSCFESANILKPVLSF